MSESASIELRLEALLSLAPVLSGIRMPLCPPTYRNGYIPAAPSVPLTLVTAPFIIRQVMPQSIGYVSFTVPYAVQFLSGVAGRNMPYYDTQLQNFLDGLFANGQIWGWEYVLAHHLEAQGSALPFPGTSSVWQRVQWDGFIEWEDGQTSPVVTKFHEQLHIKSGSTSDVHGLWVTSRGVGIRRAEFAFLVESAAMPIAVVADSNNSTKIDVVGQDLSDFQDSLTLDVFSFWELAVGISGLPTHRYAWFANTFDPAAREAPTWSSGTFNYEADSPARLVASPPVAKWRSRRRPRETRLRTYESCLNGLVHSVTVSSRSLGLLSRFTVLHIERDCLSATVQMVGDIQISLEDDRILIGDVSIEFATVVEPLRKGASLVLPHIGRYQLHFLSPEELASMAVPRMLFIHGT